MASWDHKQCGFYKDFSAIDQYETDTGDFVIPLALSDAEIAAGASPVTVVSAYAPHQRRIVHHKATKNGSPPVGIRQESVGAFHFLGATLNYPQPVQDTSLGNYDWTCYGQYEYVVTARSDPDDGFVLTGQPFTTTIRQEIQQAFGGIGNSVISHGAVAQAGTEARLGYVLGSQVSLDNPNYTWPIITFVPAIFFNSQMINGSADLPGQ